ncbi:MAG: DoxX family protein [Betaproteobacteria bacterium]|nr:DoxX family protein [Betaproteobacteria bacterium]
MVKRLARVVCRAMNALDVLAPVFDLLVRLYVAQVFFKSGLVKIQSWDSTLSLFENEYTVALLTPDLAAWLATAAELCLSPLIALGLAGRFSALALLVLNVVAAMSYPDISESGIKDHILWSWLLAMLALHGPGVFSLDFVIKKRFFGTTVRPALIDPKSHLFAPVPRETRTGE